MVLLHSAQLPYVLKVYAKNFIKIVTERYKPALNKLQYRIRGLEPIKLQKKLCVQNAIARELNAPEMRV